MLSSKAITDLFITARAAHEASQDLVARMDAVNASIRRPLKTNSNFPLPHCAVRKNPTDIVAPIVQSQVNTAHGFLNGLFLSAHPIFNVISEPDAASAVEQMNALIAQHSEAWQWKRNLSMALRDGIAYNAMAVEVSWEKRNTYITSPKALAGKSETVLLEAGNRIKHLDMYNTFWDTSVAMPDVHSEGLYAGYSERISRINFLQWWNTQLDSEKKIKTPDLEALFSAKGHYKAYSHNSLVKDKSESAYWQGVFKGQEGHNGMAGIVRSVMYARILPKDIGLKTDNPDQIQIWKFVFLGETLVLSQKQTNAHNYLPIVFGQPNEDGTGDCIPSLAEDLFDVQALVSSLFNSELRSTERVLADRAIYDPLRINPKDINSRSVSAKIPLKSAASGTDPRLAFYQIPYSDPALGLRFQQASQIAQFADLISGQNPASRGQFVRGNKTNQQFSEVMSASNDRPMQQALLLKDQFFSPIQQIVLLNTLQNQEEIQIFDPNTKKLIAISTATLVKTRFTFEIADGFLNSSRVMNEETLLTFLQAAQTNPELSIQFDIASFLVYYLTNKGLKNASQFKRSDANVAAILQQRTVAAGGAGQPAGV